MAIEKWTLVQHSGFVVGGKPAFRYAVETRIVSSTAQAEEIAQAGGLLFLTYKAADDAEFAENYPPEVDGMVPRVRGAFDRRVKVDGAPIYLPAKTESETRS